MVTGKDIAAKTGYALSTVEKVLRGHGEKYKINGESCRKILAAAKEMGYSKNEAAVITRTGVNPAIALFITMASNMHSVASKFIAGVMTEASRNDYSVQMFGYREDLKEQLEKLPGKRIRKLIFIHDKNDLHSAMVTDFAKKNDLELIFINDSSVSSDFYTVMTNDYAGVRSAIEFLLKNGHKKLGIVTADYYPERLQGTRDALAAAGILWDDLLHIVHKRGIPYEELEEKISLLLDGKDRPDAFWCFTDDIAMMVMMLAYQKNIRVPEELSLIGYGNAYPIIEYASSPLTTVIQPFQKVGEMAVQLLLKYKKYMASPGEKVVRIPVELLVRNSVKNKNKGE